MFLHYSTSGQAGPDLVILEETQVHYYSGLSISAVPTVTLCNFPFQCSFFVIEPCVCIYAMKHFNTVKAKHPLRVLTEEWHFISICQRLTKLLHKECPNSLLKMFCLFCV